MDTVARAQAFVEVLVPGEDNLHAERREDRLECEELRRAAREGVVHAALHVKEGIHGLRAVVVVAE